MFDQWLEESLGDPGALLDLAADNHATERAAGCRKLRLAAAWADCHGETDDPELASVASSVLVERFVRMGPLGTPLVAETCPSSLALAQQSSVVAARLLIGDALAVRHRLPQLWERVRAGDVWAWKAREVAHRTSQLSMVSARVVDRIVTGQVELLAWGRFEKLLEATLLQVDEKTYQQRAARAAAQRDVRATESGDGLRTLVARVDAGDATAGTYWPATRTTPTLHPPRTGRSPRTLRIRPIRGRRTCLPPAGRPTGTATCTNPPSRTSTTAAGPRNSPVRIRIRIPVGRSRRSTTPTWPGTGVSVMITKPMTSPHGSLQLRRR
jgi:hypothetical protein